MRPALHLLQSLCCAVKGRICKITAGISTNAISEFGLDHFHTVFEKIAKVE